MSEEQTAARQLLEVLGEIHRSIKVLMTNQERITKEQERAGRALGEVGVLLRNHGIQIIEISRRVGLNVDEDPPPSVTN